MISRIQKIISRSKEISHPCYSDKSSSLAKIHLPVAKECNIKCNYCERKVGEGDEVCPGHTTDIISPKEALIRVSSFIEEWGSDVVVGIAGPGDPAANQETIETLSLIRSSYKEVKLCLCSNGLELPEMLPRLKDLGVKHISLTINSLDPSTAAKIYSYITYNGEKSSSIEAYKYFISQQIKSIKDALELGFYVKVNSVVIPGINEDEIVSTSEKLSNLGVTVHNLTPLIPKGKFSNLERVSSKKLKEIQDRCSKFNTVFSKCQQCRADCKTTPIDKKRESRRDFLKATGAVVATSLLAPAIAKANLIDSKKFSDKSLDVWSCGGLAEAFIPAIKEFEAQSGAKINYTGAFAGALGKSLLGSAETEVFAPRVLGLAKKLAAQKKMVKYYPLCYTKYVIVTAKNSSIRVNSMDEIVEKSLKPLIFPEASPPGGKAVLGIYKKSGTIKDVMKLSPIKGDCVQNDLVLLLEGKADVAVVEQRLTVLPAFKGKLNVTEIPEKFVPAVPVPFTIGLMKFAKDKELAETFINFIRSKSGQHHFAKAGFIPAMSSEGERLTKKYGVENYE